MIQTAVYFKRAGLPNYERRLGLASEFDSKYNSAPKSEHKSFNLRFAERSPDEAAGDDARRSDDIAASRQICCGNSSTQCRHRNINPIS